MLLADSENGSDAVKRSEKERFRYSPFGSLGFREGTLPEGE